MEIHLHSQYSLTKWKRAQKKKKFTNTHFDRPISFNAAKRFAFRFHFHSMHSLIATFLFDYSELSLSAMIIVIFFFFATLTSRVCVCVCDMRVIFVVSWFFFRFVAKSQFQCAVYFWRSVLNAVSYQLSNDFIEFQRERESKKNMVYIFK